MAIEVILHLNSTSRAVNAIFNLKRFTTIVLVPYAPNKVLSKLSMRLKTPTLPPSRTGAYSIDLNPKTHYNIRWL